jgi:hypothetical protein
MTSLFNPLPLAQRRLLILLQNSLWDKLIDPILFEEVSHSEWNEIMTLAAIHGVLGLAYDGMKRLADTSRPPKNLLIQWELGVKQIENRYHLQVQAIQYLAEFYRENDIRCLLIKGIGISQLYPIAEHRECGDIDIYLFGDYAKGNILMERKGIKVDYHKEMHSKFFFGKIPIENHYSFLRIESYKANRDFEIVLHEALINSSPQLSEELGVYLPSLSFNLLYILKHTVGHFLGSGIVLRQLCDWALLLHKCRDIDNYPAFFETAVRFDLKQYVEAFNSLAVECLGLPGNEHFVVKEDISFAQKVFHDILKQKRNCPENFPKNWIQVLNAKLKSAVFLFRSRWKYRAVNKKIFLQELIIRLRKNSLIFKSSRLVD